MNTCRCLREAANFLFFGIAATQSCAKQLLLDSDPVFRSGCLNAPLNGMVSARFSEMSRDRLPVLCLRGAIPFLFLSIAPLLLFTEYLPLASSAKRNKVCYLRCRRALFSFGYRALQFGQVTQSVHNHKALYCFESQERYVNSAVVSLLVRTEQRKAEPQRTDDYHVGDQLFNICLCRKPIPLKNHHSILTKRDKWTLQHKCIKINS